MPVRIVFATNKGGVGKSSSTAICAEILAEAGYKVLAVDLDSQGNLTRILTGKSKYQFRGQTIMEAIQENNAAAYVQEIKEGLHLIPAEDNLATFSKHIYTTKINNPQATLKRTLEPIENHYDFVFIDVSPSLGDTVFNAIVYVDNVIIPVDSGDLGMDALVGFQEFIESAKTEGHTKAEIMGILLTMRDSRSRYERDISDGIRAAYGDLVFQTEIRRRVKLKEMSAGGVNIVSEAMEDYMALAEEILERVNRKENHHE